VPKGVGVRLVTQMTEGDPQWIIRLEEKNGSRCLSVGTDGTLGLARCAPSDARQRFQLMRGPTDEYWRVPTYRIVGVDRPPGRWLTWDPDAERLAMTAETSGALVTGWVFVDEGPAGKFRG